MHNSGRQTRGILHRAAGAVCVVLICTSGLMASRDQDAWDPKRGGYVQIERVETVLVSATVVDSKGRPVGGLSRDDFLLKEEGRVIPIEYFATEKDAPVAIAFVLDVSGSMRQEEKIQAAKDSMNTFVDALRGSDRFGLIAFADDQVAWIADFSSDKADFRRRLEVQKALGQTALFDALAACPRLVDEEIQARKAIVLFSDGLDNASHLDALRAVEIARRASVPIYAISFIPAPVDLLGEEKRDALRMLARFARETGGRDFTVRVPEDLTEAMDRIQADLRHQYVIGFEPPPRPGAAYRRIRLETTRSRLKVRARTGYYQEQSTP